MRIRVLPGEGPRLHQSSKVRMTLMLTFLAQKGDTRKPTGAVDILEEVLPLKSGVSAKTSRSPVSDHQPSGGQAVAEKPALRRCCPFLHV